MPRTASKECAEHEAPHPCTPRSPHLISAQTKFPAQGRKATRVTITHGIDVKMKTQMEGVTARLARLPLTPLLLQVAARVLRVPRAAHVRAHAHVTVGAFAHILGCRLVVEEISPALPWPR